MNCFIFLLLILCLQLQISTEKLPCMKFDLLMRAMYTRYDDIYMCVNLVTTCGDF